MSVAWRTCVAHELRLFLIALQFLTRMPVPAWCGHQPAWLNASVRYFPLVGALVGACGALVLGMASTVWPPVVAAALAVLATVWLTGAFHEDGLADTFDALGGVASRERALAIMKDSRIGTYGACALVMVLGLRVALLGTLLRHGTAAASLALIGSHAIGRCGAVLMMALLPYAGDADHAKAKPLAVGVTWRSVVPAMMVTAVGVLLLAACSAASIGWRWAVAAAMALGVVMGLQRWLNARLGGYTGDTLGATEQLCELMVLLVLAAR